MIMVGPKFVTTLAFSEDFEWVALVLKKRPEWLAGKWTAIGGHVEAGETLAEAASRELMEESGLAVSRIEPCAILHRHGNDVMVFAATSPNFDDWTSRTDEVVNVFRLGGVFCGRCPSYQSDDLKPLIQIALDCLRGSRLFYSVTEAP